MGSIKKQSNHSNGFIRFYIWSDKEAKNINDEEDDRKPAAKKRKNCASKNPAKIIWVQLKVTTKEAGTTGICLKFCSCDVPSPGFLNNMTVWFYSKPPWLTWMDCLKKEPAELYPLWVFIFFYCSSKVMDKTLIVVLVVCSMMTSFHWISCGLLILLNWHPIWLKWDSRKGMPRISNWQWIKFIKMALANFQMMK